MPGTEVGAAAGSNSASPCARLEARFARINALAEAEGMLHWDLATMMPKGGAEARGDQLAVLRALRHGLLIAPEVGDLLAEAENETAGADGDGEAAWRRANVAEMSRLWQHATALSEDQVEALSRAVSACEAAWRGARADSDFAAVAGKLETVLELVREAAAAKAEALGLAPYDALLDEYEPGGRAAEIDRTFADLETFLPGFLEEVREHQRRRPPTVMPDGPFPIERQRALAVRLMERLGFDFDHGRLDISLHPFCGGTPDDVRITTRYDEANFTSALMGVLHETGHALYERGLPQRWRRQPVGQARGMSVHESQSLLVEMQVCRSRSFLGFAAPLLKEAFAGDGPAWEADNLYRIYTRVEPGFIRVDADEVTYPAHVILRYRLERAMIAGDLAVADLPGAWNELHTKLLGLTPPDDRRGCLQDIHWYDGAWGYFPTYTLGAMTAAQLFAAAEAADPEIEPGIAAGDFTALLAWLRANVHTRGSLLATPALLRQATGRALDPAVFKAHLRRRYLG
ncbi:MAG: carboxypeptidase M32 [Rhodospirillales bacterium]|nr:carboxypeptidase M32 [Rhodospirillales bacterium]